MLFNFNIYQRALVVYQLSECRLAALVGTSMRDMNLFAVDTTGSGIYSGLGNINSSSYTLNLSDFENGVYLVKVVENGISAYHRVLKQ